MKIHHIHNGPNDILPGKPFIETHTERIPTGDNLVKAARNAIWDAWQIGLLKSENTIYPTLPLLDGVPMEPEI